MKKVTGLTLLVSLLFGSAYAQLVGDFSSGVFKDTETESINDDIHISDFRYQATSNENSIFSPLRNNAGAAFLASAIIPGAGQAANGKWVRAGIYFAVEAAGLIYHLARNAKARKQEEAYEQFTHRNWSVVAYAEWLVNYSQVHTLNNDWQQLQAEIDGKTPDYIINSNNPDTRNDWDKVNISLLHRVEKQTPFYFKDRIGSNFSHELPDYGSQQYYELISKYYQYQPGWKDWYGAITTAPNQSADMYRYFWNGEDEPFDLFYQGRDQAQEFNENYRVAGNILKLMLVNHVVSAFDALFSVQLKNSRIETETNLLKMEQFSVIWHF
ncbi:DUF5683 domain-containing protein [Gracilimonas sp.]|uniref:DUF5683 domain-containing protein n=1 Tax=Gracilimonas sp. TaxID=1974203 RepID=UPI0028726443|nr:DUF5683 domain-containing protein [Gracilimonas sp.]